MQTRVNEAKKQFLVLEEKGSHIHRWESQEQNYDVQECKLEMLTVKCSVGGGAEAPLPYGPSSRKMAEIEDKGGNYYIQTALKTKQYKGV